MKHYYKIVFPSIFLALLTFLSACKKDDPNPTTLRIKELTSVWNVSSVINDDVDVTSQFSGFKLTINDRTYSTINGGNPWPASGTYEINSTDLNTILRSDGTAVTIDEITATTLILSFNFSSLVGGRLSGVTGNFTFSLNK